MKSFKCDYSSRFKILKGGKVSLIVSAMLASVSIATASPSGEQIVSGDINIDRETANTTNINQASNKGIINWQDFSVGANHTVNFNQPSVNSSTLNRVVGNNPSNIYGNINANGQVFLVNQNGILFGQNAQVNVGGLVASTLDIKDQDFLDGNYIFEGTSQNSVINLGSINTDNAYTALLAKTVQNEGVIKAQLGKVHLASGEKITLDINGNSLVKLTIDKGTLDGLIKNKGLVQANGGQVYMTTQALDEVLNGMVNNTGVVEANTIEEKEGKIILFAHGGTGEFGGTLSTTKGAGFIETSGKEFVNKADLKVETGEWLIDPVDITIDSALAGTISAALGNGDVTIETDTPDHTDVDTTAGETANGNGDITVDSNIQWSANSILTLKAYNNIYVNAVISKSVVNGTVYGGGVKFEARNNHDAVVFGEGGLVVAINSDQLQWINTAVNGNYAIYRPIDLEGVTWTPIADFNGTLDGGTQPIENLTIDAVTVDGNAALFESIGSEGVVKNLRFESANILADNENPADVKKVAILAAENAGTIDNVTITRSNDTVGISKVGNGLLDVERIGGLVALNNHGDIVGSSSGDTQVFASEVFAAGGLVGQQTGGTITNGSSQSEVRVYQAVEESVGQTGGAVGGLVGHVDSGATISDSWIYGNKVTVEYGNEIGGVGGMIGKMDGSTLKKSYAAGQGVVDGFNYVGGLVGTSAFSTIEQTYSTYDVKGNFWVGGLVGLAKNSQGEAATIRNSYATGTVSGSSYFGGLVGRTENDKIINSYSIGQVFGSGGGGLVGSVTSKDLVQNSLWDVEASGISTGTGVGKGFAHPTSGDIGMDKFKTYKNYGWDIVEGNTDTDSALGPWYKYPILSFTTQNPGDSVWKIYGEAASKLVEPAPKPTPKLEDEAKKVIDTVVNNVINTPNVQTAPTMTQPRVQTAGTPKLDISQRRVQSSITSTAPQTVANTASQAPASSVSVDQAVKTAAPQLGESNPNDTFTVVGKTDGQDSKAIVTLEELSSASGGNGNSDIRVALSPDSFVELVNGGVRLPTGVSQEFFVVQENK